MKNNKASEIHRTYLKTVITLNNHCNNLQTRIQ